MVDHCSIGCKADLSPTGVVSAVVQERLARHGVSKRIHELHKSLAQRCPESKKRVNQGYSEELGSRYGFEQDQIVFVALHEPLGLPESILAQCLEALVGSRQRHRIVKVHPDGKQNVVWQLVQLVLRG